MNKKIVKQIRDIADKLPKVYTQCMSGGLFDTDETGQTEFIPNVYNVEVNHERRLRKAYEKLGMDGIKNYLNQIHELQKQRNEKVLRDQISGRLNPVSDVPAPVGSKDSDQNQIEDATPVEGWDWRKLGRMYS